MDKRIIGHIDMDAFFASVEERDNPRLKGRPIVVGADPEEGRGRGVVSTANYRARELGIHSAMPISKAWELAEIGRRNGGQRTAFMEVAMERYQKASENVFRIIRRSGLPMEEIGIDEVYVDLSDCGSYPAAGAMARRIQREIWKSERLTASIGIGPNKMIAKIASDRDKPNGLTVIGHDMGDESKRLVMDLLAPMEVRVIPGVGPKAEAELRRLKIRTISELRRLTRTELSNMFGKWGEELYSKARGISSSELSSPQDPKSIGEQATLRRDTLNASVLVPLMQELARGVASRFRRSGSVSFGRIVITVRFDDFTTKTRSHTLSFPARDGSILEAEAIRLLTPFLDSRENKERRKIRLLGMRVEKLSQKEQGRML